ncbi:hypothetical protein AX14_010188 [Amanita brunnescens Koide BX004]|nr:hypothetical protein AX14_010188 [Amanita brunnescens Koide BX004]
MLDAPAQNQDGSRRLKCLIEGEFDVFPVTVGSGPVSQLMKEIKRERELSTLKDVDPTTLDLYKVNIDLNTHDRHSRSRLALESIENEKLKSWETILHYWPDQPRYDHLHIIVKGLVPGEWE